MIYNTQLKIKMFPTPEYVKEQLSSCGIPDTPADWLEHYHKLE